MPKDEDRSTLLWISPGFDTSKIAWMIAIVNASARHGTIAALIDLNAYDNMSKGMDRKKETKKPKKDKKK